MQILLGTSLFLLFVALLFILHFQWEIKTLKKDKIDLYCQISDRDQKVTELQENNKKVYQQLCCLNYKIKNQPMFGMNDTIGKFIIIGEPVVEMAFVNEAARLMAVGLLCIFDSKYKSPQSFVDVLQHNPLCHYVYPVQTNLLKKPFKISETQLIKLLNNLKKTN